MNRRLTPESEMKFGFKYKGKKLKDIPKEYWLWGWKEKVFYAKLRRYVQDYILNNQTTQP